MTVNPGPLSASIKVNDISIDFPGRTDQTSLDQTDQTSPDEARHQTSPAQSPDQTRSDQIGQDQTRPFLEFAGPPAHPPTNPQWPNWSQGRRRRPSHPIDLFPKTAGPLAQQLPIALLPKGDARSASDQQSRTPSGNKRDPSTTCLTATQT